VPQLSQRHAGTHTSGLEWRETDSRVTAYARLLSKGINQMKPLAIGKGSSLALTALDGTQIRVGWGNDSNSTDPVYGLRVGDSKRVCRKAKQLEVELGPHVIEAAGSIFYELIVRREGGRLSSELLQEAEKLGVVSVSVSDDSDRYATITLPDSATGKMIRYTPSKQWPTNPVERRKFEAELISEARQVIASTRQEIGNISDQAVSIRRVTGGPEGEELSIRSGFRMYPTSLSHDLKYGDPSSYDGVDSLGYQGQRVQLEALETVPLTRHMPTERYYTFDREGEERRGGIKVVTFRPDESSENPYDSEPDRESYVIVGGFLANDQGGAGVYQEFCEAVARLTGKNVRFVEFVRDDTSRLGAGSGPGWKREHPVSRFTSRVEKRVKEFSDDFQREIKSKSKLEINRIFDMVDALREEGISRAIMIGHSLGGLGAEFAKNLADKTHPEMIDFAFGEAAVGHNKAYPVPAKLLGLFAWDEVFKNPGKVLLGKGTKDEKRRVRNHTVAALKAFGRGPIRRFAEIAGIRKTQITPQSTYLAGVIQPENDRVFGLSRMDSAFGERDGYISEGKGEHNTIIVDPESAAEEFIEFVHNTRERFQATSPVGDVSI